MKKIIHLSDLHIGHADMMQRFHHITGMINALKRPSQNYVIVITGDLVEHASDSHYEDASNYIRALRDYGYTVLVAPGNHDYSELVFNWKGNVKKFKKTFFGTTNLDYPKLDIVEYDDEGDVEPGFEKKIAFMGLDSMADELHWYDSFWANGELGDKQLRRLKTMLRKDEVEACRYKVVYLHHHPFDPQGSLHRLKDAEEFCTLLKEYVSDGYEKHEIHALLFGHNHTEYRPGANWNGYIENISRSYDAGTSTWKYNVRCAHRVIDLSRDARYDYDGEFMRGFIFNN